MIKAFYRAHPSKKVKNLILSAMKNKFAPILCKRAIKKLKEESAKCKTIEDHINLALTFGFEPFNIRPTQKKLEILQLMKILAKLAPKAVLEIGTARGGTLYLFTKVASKDALIISIDLPGGPFGGGYPQWKIPLYHSFSSADQRIYLLRMNSHDEATLRKVKRIFGNIKINFLFIDGDHDEVKRDFEMYGKLVERGGIIAFHDIITGSPENVGRVPEFWNEIKRDFRHAEIVEDRNQNGHGIGIIFK